jgi:hypothetical protein
MFKRHIIMVNDMAFKTSWPSSQSTYLMLLVVVVVAATVFSLTVVRYVGEGCVIDYRRWGPFAGGSPYYISLYVDSLIPYTRSYCVHLLSLHKANCSTILSESLTLDAK